MTFTIVILNHNYSRHSNNSLPDTARTSCRTFDELIQSILEQHRKRCSCRLEAEEKLWVSDTVTEVNGKSSLDHLSFFTHTSWPASILEPASLVLYLRLRRAPQPERQTVRQRGQAADSNKRQRAPSSSPPPARDSPRLSLVEKSQQVFQVVRSTESGQSTEPVWETRGDFAAILNTVGAVLIDNSAPLGRFTPLTMANTSACVTFASPSEYAAMRFSSTLAVAFDMCALAAWSLVSQKVDFFRKLAAPSYTVLRFDFDGLMKQPRSSPRYAESTASVQVMVEQYITRQVREFVTKYSGLVPCLHDFLANFEEDNSISTLLHHLSEGHASLLVCVHGFEQVLERPTLCSLWDSHGIHASIRPLIKTVDDMIFSPIAHSYREKGVVRKIAITGTNPHLYLNLTHVAGLPGSADFSPVAIMRPLHGLPWLSSRILLFKFESRPRDTSVARRNYDIALAVKPDELLMVHDASSRHITPNSVPIDIGVLIRMMKLLQTARSTQTRLTVTDFDSNVKLLIRYQKCLPMVFPLVCDMPSWLKDLVNPSTADGHPLVEVATSFTSCVWRYDQHEVAARRDDGTSLPFALLVSLGLLRLRGHKNDVWTCSVAGGHAKQTLQAIIATVEEYNTKPLSRLAQTSVETFTLSWLQGALLEGLKDKPPMENEAAFQEFALEFLQDFLQHNGQWRHQAQAEPWFRCGTAEKCRDQRGDIAMTLKMNDGSWRFYIYELKFFEALATAKATQEHIQKCEPERALPESYSGLEYFEAVLRHTEFEPGSGWVSTTALLPALPDIDFDPEAFVIKQDDLRAEYLDTDTNCREVKQAVAVGSYSRWQSTHYVRGAIQRVGAELGTDEPGIADVRFTEYDNSATFMAVFIPVALLLVSNVLLFGWEGNEKEQKAVKFRPAVAGVFPWTEGPKWQDIQRIRRDKAASRKESDKKA